MVNAYLYFIKLSRGFLKMIIGRVPYLQARFGGIRRLSELYVVGPRGFEPPDHRLRRPVLAITKFHMSLAVYEIWLDTLIILVV